MYKKISIFYLINENYKNIIKSIGDSIIKRIACILLVLIMITGVVFAEESQMKLPKYTTADKVAITVFTAVTAVVVTFVVKEVVVDGVCGVRKWDQVKPIL